MRTFVRKAPHEYALSDGTLTLVFTCLPHDCFSVHNVTTALRSKNGAISVEIRLAVALRVLAGGSYMDAGVIYGIGFNTVYACLWNVIDGINRTKTVGQFRFPQKESDCKIAAEKWQVWLKTIASEHDEGT